MNRKTRTALLALALSCAAGITSASPAAAEEDVPPCLDIVDLHDWSLAQNDAGVWILTLTQELASPSCSGGATYSLHAFLGTSTATQAHSSPDGLGTSVLTFSVPVHAYEITCTETHYLAGIETGSTDHTRYAVGAYATTERGSHGDVTPTGTFNSDPALCGPPGSAGWS